MKKRMKFILLLLVTVVGLTGCMRTVDQMYRVPKRSNQFTELQAAIDGSMTGLAYCAPVTGENQQAVQMADLNGDGKEEYILFAKEDAEHPLRILIFKQTGDSFVLGQTIESSGASFDTVEYVDMDSSPGLEIVFGSQLTDQLVRNVCVYAFTDTLDTKLLVSANYMKFLCADLDSNGASELFVLKPGPTETDKGIAELYTVVDGKVERTNELEMSGPADKLKRVLVSKIQGDIPAVYVATTVADSALITDVYIYNNGSFLNVTASNESGTSVRTLRNYYVYADDIDGDGVTELPYLMPMMPMDNVSTGNRQELIRWYSMTDTGEEVVKTYTFHNFIGGWYMDLDSDWAAQLTVVDLEDSFEFYIWDPEYTSAEKVLTVFLQSRQNRETEHVILSQNESVLFTAKLEECAERHGFTPENVRNRFHLINQAWKTGET